MAGARRASGYFRPRGPGDVSRRERPCYPQRLVRHHPPTQALMKFGRVVHGRARTAGPGAFCESGFALSPSSTQRSADARSATRKHSPTDAWRARALV